MGCHSHFNGVGRGEPVGPRHLVGGPIDVILGSIWPMSGLPEHPAGDVAHGIEPASIVKQVNSPLVRMSSLDYYDPTPALSRPDLPDAPALGKRITELEKAMRAAAKELDFERAAEIRDELRSLRELQIFRS